MLNLSIPLLRARLLLLALTFSIPAALHTGLFAQAPDAQPTHTDVYKLDGGDVIMQFNHVDREGSKPSDATPSRVRIFIPGDTQQIRAIIFDLGYTYTSDRSDLQAVARAEGYAVIGCLLRYKEGTELLNVALEDFAKRSNHPELVDAPIFPMGFSRNGSRAFTFLEENEEKTVALALGGNPGIAGKLNDPRILALAQKTPILTVVGSRDPYVDYDKGKDRYWHIAVYPRIRAYENVTWGMMIGWNYGHSWEGSWAMYVPFFKETLRLRAKGAPGRDGKTQLEPVSFEEGWLAEYGWENDWPEIAPVKSFKGDRKNAIWLPTEQVAAVWRAYNVKEPKVTLEVKAGEGGLTLSAEAPEGTKSISFYDGAKQLGVAKAAPFELTTDTLGAETHSVYAVAETADGNTPSRPVTIAGGKPVDWKSGDADQVRADSSEQIVRISEDQRQVLMALLEKGAEEASQPNAAEIATLKDSLEALTKSDFVEQRIHSAKLLGKLSEKGPIEQ